MMSSEPRSVVGPCGHVTGAAVFKDGRTRVFKGAGAFVSADLRLLLPAGGRSDDDLITASARPLEIPAPPHLAALK